jgi:hypothetical protein
LARYMLAFGLITDGTLGDIFGRIGEENVRG